MFTDSPRSENCHLSVGFQIRSSAFPEILGLFLSYFGVIAPELSLLSYTSILGILSTILLVVVVLADGLSKTEYPGSLWSPAETSLSISSWTNLGLAYGLFMAGVRINRYLATVMFAISGRG